MTHATHVTHAKILWTHATHLKISTHDTHAEILWTHATHATHAKVWPTSPTHLRIHAPTWPTQPMSQRNPRNLADSTFL